MKTMKRILAILTILLVTTILFSCSADDSQSQSQNHVVKVYCSGGVSASLNGVSMNTSSGNNTVIMQNVKSGDEISASTLCLYGPNGTGVYYTIHVEVDGVEAYSKTCNLSYIVP